MKILISGASGLVGSALVDSLVRGGNEVRRLVRDGDGEDGVRWNVETGEIDDRALAAWGGPEAGVHLAGENIGEGRWTEKKKRRIRESRVEGTEWLAKSLARLGRVRTFVSASAIGFYGDRGDEVLTERSAKGTGFLADTCESWEAAARPIAEAGARVVHLRFGMILSAEGGALGRMLPVFCAGLGGRLGSGRQWMSWISRADVVRAIEFALREIDAAHEVKGAFNAVAPNPVRNLEFTKELGRALGRPTVFPVPAFGLRLIFGEMADALLLSSAGVLPERLLQAGFQFEHPTLREALGACLGAARTKN
jgi:uncharacterized protein